MLGLMAFTLALTISFAQDRFESRRHGALIEEYALGRLSYLVALSPNAAAEALARTTNTLQTKIWQRALPMLDGMPPLLASALISSQRHVRRQPCTALRKWRAMRRPRRC